METDNSKTTSTSAPTSAPSHTHTTTSPPTKSQSQSSTIKVKLPWLKLAALAILISISELTTGHPHAGVPGTSNVSGLEPRFLYGPMMVAAAAPTPPYLHHPGHPHPHYLESRQGGGYEGGTYGFVSAAPKHKMHKGKNGMAGYGAKDYAAATKMGKKGSASDLEDHGVGRVASTSRLPAKGLGYGPFGGMFGPGPVMLDESRKHGGYKNDVAKRDGEEGGVVEYEDDGDQTEGPEEHVENLGLGGQKKMDDEDTEPIPSQEVAPNARQSPNSRDASTATLVDSAKYQTRREQDASPTNLPLNDDPTAPAVVYPYPSAPPGPTAVPQAVSSQKAVVSNLPVGGNDEGGGHNKVVDTPEPTANAPVVDTGSPGVHPNPPFRYGHAVPPVEYAHEPKKGGGKGSGKGKGEPDKNKGKKDDGNEKEKHHGAHKPDEKKKHKQKEPTKEKEKDSGKDRGNGKVGDDEKKVAGAGSWKGIDYTHEADYEVPPIKTGGLGHDKDQNIDKKPNKNQPKGNAKPNPDGKQPQAQADNDDDLEDCEDEPEEPTPASPSNDSTAPPLPGLGTPGSATPSGNAPVPAGGYDYTTGRYGRVGYAESYYASSNATASTATQNSTSKTSSVEANLEADQNSSVATGQGRGRNGTKAEIQAHAEAQVHESQSESQLSSASNSTNYNATVAYSGQAQSQTQASIVDPVSKNGTAQDAASRGGSIYAITKGAKVNAEKDVSSSSSTTTVTNTTNTRTTTMKYDANLNAVNGSRNLAPNASAIGEARIRPRPNDVFGYDDARLDINKSSSNSSSQSHDISASASRTFGMQRTSYVGAAQAQAPGQVQQGQGQVITSASEADSSNATQIANSSNENIKYAANATYSSGTRSGSANSGKPRVSGHSPGGSFQYTASGIVNATSDSAVSYANNNSTKYNATSEVKSTTSAVLTGGSGGKRIDYTHDMPKDYYGDTSSASAGSASHASDSKDTNSTSRTDRNHRSDHNAHDAHGDYDKTDTSSSVKVNGNKSGTGYTVSQTVNATETLKQGNITATRYGQMSSTWTNHGMGAIAASLARAGAGAGGPAAVVAPVVIAGRPGAPVVDPANPPVHRPAPIPLVPQHPDHDADSQPAEEVRLSYICEKRFVRVRLSPDVLKKATVDLSKVVGKSFEENGPRSQEEVTAFITKVASAGGLRASPLVFPDQGNESGKDKAKRHVVGDESKTKDGGREYGIWTRLCIPKGFVGEVKTSTNAEKTNEAKVKESILEFAIHGINFDQNYWSFGGRGSPYNYLESAIRAGHAIFTFDRLGVGRTDKPRNGISDVQRGIEIEVAAELLKYLRGHRKYKFDKVVGVGHSFGSSQLVGLASEYGNLFDAMVLSGFTAYGGGLPATLTGWGLRIAAERLPRRFGPLPSSYLVTGGIYNDQTTFFDFPYYDFDVLVEADKMRQPVTIGEILTSSMLESAPAYQKPVLVVTGDKDIIFCSGNCLQPMNNASNVVAATRSLFPNVQRFDTYIPPHTGHGVNLHFGAEITFAVIQKWLTVVL